MKNIKLDRTIILSLVLLLLFGVVFQRLWKLQIVDGQMYADNFEVKTTKTLTEENTRGIIYDRNGQVLAENKLVYTIIMTDSGEYNTSRERQLELNGTIYRLLKRLRQKEEQLNHELKIKVNAAGEYEYTAAKTALKRFQADVFGEADPKNMSKEQADMTALELVDYLAGNEKFALYGAGDQAYTKKELKEYGLEESYNPQDVLDILGIRYMLSLHAYQKYQPVTIAKDISEETMAYIMENQENLPGIEIGKEWKRVYGQKEPFAHILGYTQESKTGMAGIEQYMDKELQGTDTINEVTVNNVGKAVGEPVMIREGERGQDVYLSLDKDLQNTVYHILEQNIAGILSANLINAKEFDKTNIRDTTEIRIPVGDVYRALVRNEIIRTDSMRREDASVLEQKTLEKLQNKKAQTWEQIYLELSEGGTIYKELSEEMKTYQKFIVSESSIFKEDAVDKKDTVYLSWNQTGDISLKEFLYYAIAEDWTAASGTDSPQKYAAAEDLYQLLLEDLEKELKDSHEFEKILMQELIRSGSISEKEVCELLYDQGILSKEEEDYKSLQNSILSPFSFIKKKIDNLEITPAQLALDPCSGSAVVLERTTGKVLACVSYPGYDNNRLANEMDADYYNQLIGDGSLPLYNRATQQLSAPGSTFKPVTIIAGLQEGVISSDTGIFCDGVFDSVSPPLKCWNHAGHGAIADAPGAISNSCNDYLCEIAYRLGTKAGTEYKDQQSLATLQKYAALFDLDKKTGIELPESEPDVTDAYGIPSAIGQGTHNYTTAQLARYVNTIASRGDSFSLSVLDKTEAPGGNIEKMEVELSSKAELPEPVWDTVQSGMIQFARNNAVLKDMQIAIAGKTGTAQESKSRPDHSLFMGYAPAENPEISVAVRIANGYGSSNATLVGKSIFEYYFGIKSTEEIITGRAANASNARSD